MIESIDTSLTLFLYNFFPRSPLFDWFPRILSFEGTTTLFWIFVAGIIFIYEFYIKKNKLFFIEQLTKMTLTFFATIAITAFCVHFVIKPIFQRVRPFQTLGIEAPYCPTDFSFPSGHAAVAVAGAYVLSKFDHNRRRDYLYASIAIAIGLSRIYLLCHYVTDVIVGSVFGLFVAVITFQVVHLLYHKSQKLKI